MYPVKLLISCTLTALITTLGVLFLLTPVQDLNATQRAVLDEYLATYCVKDTTHNGWFVVGQSAALSRIVVRANLGNLALIEYAKCKIWIQ
jgi:hypothetical protein